MTATEQENGMRAGDTVVLVHGLGGSRLDMWPIGRRLRQSGCELRNFGYVSLGYGIEVHVRRFGHQLKSLDQDCDGSRFHLVTHSMGGIIARAILARHRFHHLGRVVMLAPPHRGSHVARKLAPWLGWLVPGLQQLSDAADSFVNRLPNSLLQQNIEFGIVEAGKDRVIAPGGVHLPGLRDLAVVSGHHGILPWYPETARLVHNFLSYGAFQGLVVPEGTATAGC
jgi:pimeloyl-ACP methyl ester carboxylesterase